MTDDAEAAVAAASGDGYPEEGEAGRPVPDLTIADGVVIHGHRIIGAVDYHEDGLPMLTLDLGWLRLGGVAIKLLDDREGGDSHRNGVFLER